MRRRTTYLILICFSLPLGLSACSLPGSCGWQALGQPIPVEPVGNSVIGEPRLHWTYPESYRCRAEVYQFQLAHDLQFSNLVESGATGGGDTTWEPMRPFEPLREYWWRVAAGVKSADGVRLGPWSIPARFFTGPLCGPDQLQAPRAVTPLPGELLKDPAPFFSWEDPTLLNAGCIPADYRIEISTNPSFSEGLISADSGSPARAWIAAQALTDCRTYFWRVIPRLDAYSGPPSAVQSFRIDQQASCAPASGISGVVWHDECALPWLGPSPPGTPAGCVDAGGFFTADGVREPLEVGIPNVRIELGFGACPSTGLATAITGEDGSYQFPELQVGRYCVSIDSLGESNQEQLIPGTWSSPLSNGALTNQVIVVETDRTYQVDFGWDFQYLPLVEGASISGMVWHDLCAVSAGPPPAQPPPGCLDAKGGVLDANGILESGEPGIEGVVIDLGSGSCPASGTWSVRSEADGSFRFEGLSPGIYCVSVDVWSHENEAQLVPGGWTHPAFGLNPAGYEFIVADSTPIENANFGWDYQFLPEPEAKQATARKNISCRAGPTTEYEVLAIILENERLVVEARNRGASWFWVQRSDQQNSCWVATNNLAWNFDESELPLRRSPP